MSRTLFCRPSFLHSADRVLSASTESGLMVGPPVADTANVGTLVLRASGQPYEVADIAMRLQTGGGPDGYSLVEGWGRPLGAEVRWKNDTDSVTQWRGFDDSIQLVKIDTPITGAPFLAPGTPRELPDGYLGIFVAGSGFYRISTSWVSSSATSATGDTGFFFTGLGNRGDFVVLPSGRLIAAVCEQFAAEQNQIVTFYSDDYGATWTLLSDRYYATPTTGTMDDISLEYVGDSIVAVVATTAGADVLISNNGGGSFSLVGTGVIAAANVSTCVADGKIVAVARQATTLWAWSAAPGGNFGTPVTTTGSTNGDAAAVVRRDDGVLFAFAWESGAANTLAMSLRISLDGGVSWADGCAGANVTSYAAAGYATNGYSTLSAGMWGEKIIVVGQTDATAGTTGVLHFMVFGQYSNITPDVGDVTNNPAGVTLFSVAPIDDPQVMGWTRTDVGAGATVTHSAAWTITNGAGDASSWASPAAWWVSTVGDRRIIRFRLSMPTNAGSVTDNRSRIQFAQNDGVNSQIINLRVKQDTLRLVDGAGTQIGADLTIAMATPVDFFVAFKHDSGVGVGHVSVWYKQDGSDLYTLWINSLNVTETAATVVNGCAFGGTVGGGAVLRVHWIGNALAYRDYSSGFTNPDELIGRAITAGHDIAIKSGINLGGRNTGGVPGDTYTVATTYSRGKEQVWRDLRPSRYVASSADNAAWNEVFDAGAADRFKPEIVALIGTNMRTATVEFDTANSFAPAPLSVSLNATVWSGTVSASAVYSDRGYIGSSSAEWRSGQFKSDGDAHRWFVQVGTDVYEITDNDESRIYVEGVNFSAVAGGTALYIFADRMAARIASQVHYRYARILIASQDTADGEYRIGTPIFDEAFDLTELYEHGYVDASTPNLVITQADSGHRQITRKGPRRLSLAIQYGPQDRQASDWDERYTDFMQALEGGAFFMWRDTSDPTSCGLYTSLGPISRPNILGEHESWLGRIDQTTLEEFW